MEPKRFTLEQEALTNLTQGGIPIDPEFWMTKTPICPPQGPLPTPWPH
ncbi:MAG TPA: hypothetical protein VHA33_21835 [Candidatus Angelobacter sp.]|jgi:hypothetical protein|nr:hypothetical protein [Candidatus Angelobacter sp.]